MQNLQTNTEIDSDDESDNENPTETLIHGLVESQQIHDLHDKIVELAPAEG
jgi:hypothetical protein